MQYLLTAFYLNKYLKRQIQFMLINIFIFSLFPEPNSNQHDLNAASSSWLVGLTQIKLTDSQQVKRKNNVKSFSARDVGSMK